MCLGMVLLLSVRGSSPRVVSTKECNCAYRRSRFDADTAPSQDWGFRHSLEFRGSSMAEQTAVNRSVVGSTPAPGAICILFWGTPV